MIFILGSSEGKTINALQISLYLIDDFYILESFCVLLDKSSPCFSLLTLQTPNTSILTDSCDAFQIIFHLFWLLSLVAYPKVLF